MRKKIWTANDLAHSFTDVAPDAIEASAGGEGDAALISRHAESVRLGGEGGEGGGLPAFIKFGAEGGEG